MTPVLPETSEHPGLKLMARASAMLRAGGTAGTADVAGGAMLEAEAPQRLSDDALARALDRIDALQTVERRVLQAAETAGRRLGEIAGLPDPVREAAFAALESGERWTFAGLGIRRLILPVGGSGKTEILRIEPGHGAPRHDHEGEEYTLVMTGAFHDGHGLYGPGDINVGEPGFTHQPVARPGEVCFALAVSWGEPRFEGVFGLMQKVTRH